MAPILFSIGPIHLYSYSVFIILAWGIFSFLFWRMLRGDGVDEDKIFNFTFYSTLSAFVCARIFFVV
jgi:prolipoprotein diacylglyceryltransferase